MLISFVVMGFLGLAATSVRTSRQADEVAVARANARMALFMAMGQLQRTAGDDRRVTVAADLLSDAPDGASTSAVEGRRHWTGV
ncbi:MAG: hypothetical protein ACQKBY_10010, partial [Verrucomicrobiales bacterium]